MNDMDFMSDIKIDELQAEVDRLTVECNVKKVFIEKLEKRVKELEEQLEQGA